MSSGSCPFPADIPMPLSKGAKETLPLRGPWRELFKACSSAQVGPRPAERSHMQENSQLRESLCWSHTPKGAVWSINSHCPALPRRWSPREPEKSLLQGTKIQRGVQPLGELQSQDQDEKPGPAHCPPPPCSVGGIPAAPGDWLQP